MKVDYLPQDQWPVADSGNQWTYKVICLHKMATSSSYLQSHFWKKEPITTSRQWENLYSQVLYILG